MEYKRLTMDDIQDALNKLEAIKPVPKKNIWLSRWNYTRLMFCALESPFQGLHYIPGSINVHMDETLTDRQYRDEDGIKEF
jgi:hypothetical protein